MTIRRTAAALGAVAVGLFALSACSKPTPLATVTVGDSSVHGEAACYHDGKPLSSKEFQECLEGAPHQSIKVPVGGSIHIGVDPVVADEGWAIAEGTQGVSGGLTSTYHTLSPDLVSQLFSDSTTGAAKKSVTLNLIEISGGTKFLGVWHFTLEKAN